jgi:hypothetical protein
MFRSIAVSALPKGDIGSFAIVDGLSVDGVSKYHVRPLNAFVTRSIAFGPSGSDGANSENVLKSANARCRSLFSSHDMPRL